MFVGTGNEGGVKKFILCKLSRGSELLVSGMILKEPF